MLLPEDITAILEMIRDEGAQVTLVADVVTPTDPAKPWLGGTTVETPSTVWIAFVDQATAAAMISQWKGDAEVPSSTRFGIMGNHGVEPEVGNRVVRPGKEDMTVKDVMTAAPADVPVFHVLEFSA